MKRRIFIAIDLPPDLKQGIGEAIKQWQWLPIRWLAPGNWHITLIPPVYLEDDEAKLLIARLQKSRLGRAFTAVFSQVTLAPPGGAARMVWLEGKTPPELLQLKEKLEILWARESGLPPVREEARPLKLHVTLARFEAGELRELEKKTRVLGEVKLSSPIGEIVVMESHLRPSGAEHETLATIPM